MEEALANASEARQLARALLGWILWLWEEHPKAALAVPLGLIAAAMGRSESAKENTRRLNEAYEVTRRGRDEAMAMTRDSITGAMRAESVRNRQEDLRSAHEEAARIQAMAEAGGDLLSY